MAQALASTRQSPETVAHLVGLLRDFEAATLVTRSRGGSLHGRPMSIAGVDDDVTIWFVTGVRSTKADEVAEDSRAMVTLQSHARFLCLNGNVELVFDPERIKALWKDSYRAWCDGGDRDVVLLRFSAFDAEYWDDCGSSGLKYALQAARAYVAGNKLEERAELQGASESHAKLRLWDTGDANGSAKP